VRERQLRVQQPREHPHPKQRHRVVVFLRRSGSRGLSAQRLLNPRNRVVEGGRRAQTLERQRQVRRMVERLRHIVTISHYSKSDNILADFGGTFPGNSALLTTTSSLAAAAKDAEHESAGQLIRGHTRHSFAKSAIARPLAGWRDFR